MIPGERTFREALAGLLTFRAGMLERRRAYALASRAKDLAILVSDGEQVPWDEVLEGAWRPALQDAFGSLAEVDRMDEAMRAAVLVDEEGVARG